MKLSPEVELQLSTLLQSPTNTPRVRCPVCAHRVPVGSQCRSCGTVIRSYTSKSPRRSC